MGGQTQSKSSPSLDRRQLLTSSAAVTVAGIVPMETTDPPVLNVCAATARRIEEIVARDQIRHEARLPLLSIPKELRRMKTVDDAAEFEEGFIQPESGGKDVFVHISAVERAGLSTLNEGQVVEYEVVANRGKEAAEKLKVK